jgi:colicin import membrane protein
MNFIEQEAQQETESINRGLWVSAVVHAVVFSLFVVKSVFFAHESINYQAAVRVDLVALPDKIEPGKTAPLPTPQASVKPAPSPSPVATPEKKAAEKPAPKVAPIAKKDPDAVNLAKQKSKEKAALEKLKAMEALEKIKEDVANEQQKKTPPPQKIKGNVLSAGSALTGLSKLQHDTYVADLDTHIKQNWSLPEWLAKKDYKAQVRVRIDDRGNILSRQIIKSSGNQSYDAEVLATVDRSAPFPPPPEKFVSIVGVDGILIGFPE